MEDYAPSRYKMLEKIGEGVHGCVFKAIDLQRNKEVAIKKVALKNKFGNIALNTLREIKTLQLCKSEYVGIPYIYFPFVNYVTNCRFWTSLIYILT